MIKNSTIFAHNLFSKFHLSLQEAKYALNLSGKQQQAKERVQNALQKLNSMTGYDQIERLKLKVRDSEKSYALARESLGKARSAYEKSVMARSNCQRDINGLLQRKHTWSPEDVSKFTELYAKDHTLEHSEVELRRMFEKTEKQVEEAHNKMLDSIRQRYQEEQIWSDNIRSLSSYGTIALMVANITMFIGVHSFMEPRRRRNLVDNVEQRISQRVEEVEREFKTSLLATQAVILEEIGKNQSLLHEQVEDINSMVYKSSSSSSYESGEVDEGINGIMISAEKNTSDNNGAWKSTMMFSSGIVCGGAAVSFLLLLFGNS